MFSREVKRRKSWKYLNLEDGTVKSEGGIVISEVGIAKLEDGIVKLQDGIVKSEVGIVNAQKKGSDTNFDATTVVD
jgi:hypothetical protein